MLKTFLICAILACSFIINATADLASGVVEQIDPGRTGERLTDKPEIIEAPSEKQIIKLPKMQQQFDQEEAEKIKFRLKKVIITGNTIYSNKILEKFYISRIGQQISIADLQDIADNITDYYRENGYILTQVIIPEQEIDDGVVTLNVVEGYIDKVSIEGAKAPSIKKLLIKYAKRIQSIQPLKLESLERYSLLANDIPGAQIKTVITPSDTTPGAANLVFVVREKLFDIDLGTSNFNSELLGRQQFSLSANANALTIGGQTGLRGIVSAKKNRLSYYAANHRQALNGNGLTITGSISDTKTRPMYTSIDLQDLNTPGDSFLILSNVFYPLIRSRAKNFSIGAGFMYINTYTDLENIHLFNDQIRSVSIKMSYDFLDRFSSTTLFELTAFQGLNIMGAKASPPSRPGGKTDFTKIEVYAHRYQRLYQHKLFLFLALKSQYSFNQLLSAEKFGFGGSHFGYGYDPASIVGDQGIAGRAELQRHFSKFYKHMQMSQIFLFLDAAATRNLNKQIIPYRSDAVSAGAGARFRAIKNFTAELFFAKPFNKLITNGQDTFRFIFNLNYHI